jgi:outer membrane protein TolC
MRAWISRCLLMVLLTASVGGMAEARAATALLEAVENAPMLEAARKRIEASRSRTEAAGRFADPEIEGMATRANGPDNAEMYEVTVMQPLPKRGERAADRERAQAAVQMSEAEYAMAAGELAADVAMALAEAGGAEARAAVLETQLGRLDSVLKNIDARLSTATTSRFADRLAVQTRVAAMQLEIEELRRTATDALEEASGRLGLAPGVGRPDFAAPTVEEIDPADAAALSLAAARVSEAEAMGKMARSSGRPMTGVGLRFESERSGMGNAEALGVVFSSEIPFRSRRYARAEALAAEAEREAAEAEGRGARYRIASAVSRVERAERLAERARSVARETRARLDAQYEALVRAAGTGSASGESTVLMAVEILEQVTDTELKVIDADVAARVARAELWRYVPVHRFLSNKD